jgi:hypothetical protein
VDEAPNWARRGAGGVVSTTDDLLRWVQALRTDHVLSAEARRKLWTPALDDYAYGWSVRSTPQGRVIAHNGGSTAGVGADVRIWPDHDLVIVVLGNDDGENVVLGRGGVDRQVASIVFGDSLPPLPAPLEGAAARARIATFAGTYLLPSGGRISVQPTGTLLRVTAEGQDALAAVAAGTAPDAKAAEDAIATARALADAGMRGDTAAARVAMAGRAPLGGLMAMRERLTARLGEYRGSSGIGAMVRNPGDPPMAFLRLDFAQGPAYAGIVLGPNGIFGWMPMMEPPSTLFRPLADDGEAAAIDWQTGTAKVLRLTDGLTTLRIATPAGEVVARKQ